MKKQSKRPNTAPAPAPAPVPAPVPATRRVAVKKKKPKTNTDERPSPAANTRRVTFWLPAVAAPGATTVVVAGAFNGWSVDRHPLTRQENGDFSVEIDLETGKEYEFRFVIDRVRWQNAWNADKYVWNDAAQCENSVVIA